MRVCLAYNTRKNECLLKKCHCSSRAKGKTRLPNTPAVVLCLYVC